MRRTSWLRPRGWVLRAGVAVFALSVVAVGVVGGDGTRHPGPWPLAADGRPTGFYAVATLQPGLGGPVAELTARAATDLDVGLPATERDQEVSRQRAWAAALLLSRAAGVGLPAALVPPAMPAPEAWFGTSTGLAYALAYLDSAPLNPTPGSLAAGRRIAATGVVGSPFALGGVYGVPAKYAAAQEAGASVFLVPLGSYADAIGSGWNVPRDPGAPTVAGVVSLLDAVAFLCRTGGTGAVCGTTAVSDVQPFAWVSRVLAVMRAPGRGGAPRAAGRR